MNKLNKFQIALDRLKEISVSEDQLKLYAIIQELIDKETPMKLKGEIYHQRCRKCGNPNLNTKFTWGLYCSGCGQKIDWSDEDVE